MKNICKKTLSTLAFCALFSTITYGQDFDVVFDLGTDDANTYLKSYSAPSIAAFGNGLAGGWYNTGKPHKLLGFDLTLTASAVTIPSEDITFVFKNDDYTNLSFAGGAETGLPTLTGPETKTSLQLSSNATFTAGGQTYQRTTPAQPFDAPSGAGLGNQVYVPSLQFGIGVIKNTDLMFRYIPTVSLGPVGIDAEIGLFGIGVKHDIKQWIPGIKNLPFDLSVLLASTTMKIIYNSEFGNEGDAVFFKDGSTEFKTSATTFQVIASKKLSVITPYVGIGFNAVKSSLKVSGDLQYQATLNGGTTQTVSIKDPIDIDFDNAGSTRITAGLRLKLAIFTFHADYTVQKYSMFTAGFGFNVR